MLGGRTWPQVLLRRLAGRVGHSGHDAGHFTLRHRRFLPIWRHLPHQSRQSLGGILGSITGRGRCGDGLTIRHVRVLHPSLPQGADVRSHDHGQQLRPTFLFGQRTDGVGATGLPKGPKGDRAAMARYPRGLGHHRGRRLLFHRLRVHGQHHASGNLGPDQRPAVVALLGHQWRGQERMFGQNHGARIQGVDRPGCPDHALCESPISSLASVWSRN